METGETEAAKPKLDAIAEEYWDWISNKNIEWIW